MFLSGIQSNGKTLRFPLFKTTFSSSKDSNTAALVGTINSANKWDENSDLKNNSEAANSSFTSNFSNLEATKLNNQRNIHKLNTLKSSFNNPIFDYNNNEIDNYDGVKKMAHEEATVIKNATVTHQTPPTNRFYSRQVSLDTYNNLNHNACSYNFRSKREIRENSNNSDSTFCNINHRHFSFGSPQLGPQRKDGAYLSRSSGSIEIFKRRNRLMCVDINISNDFKHPNSSGINLPSTPNHSASFHSRVSYNGRLKRFSTLSASSNASNDDRSIKSGSSQSHCRHKHDFSSKNMFRIRCKKRRNGRTKPYKRLQRRLQKCDVSKLVPSNHNLFKNVLYISTKPTKETKKITIFETKEYPLPQLQTTYPVEHIENSASSNSGETLVPEDYKQDGRFLNPENGRSQDSNDKCEETDRSEQEESENIPPPKLPPRIPLKYSTLSRGSKQDRRRPAGFDGSVTEDLLGARRSWNEKSELENIQHLQLQAPPVQKKHSLELQLQLQRRQGNPQQSQNSSSQLLKDSLANQYHLCDVSSTLREHTFQHFETFAQNCNHKNQPFKHQQQQQQQQHFPHGKPLFKHTNQHPSNQQYLQLNDCKVNIENHLSNNSFIFQEKHWPLQLTQKTPILVQKNKQIQPIPLSTSSSLEFSGESLNSDDAIEEHGRERREMDAVINGGFDEEVDEDVDGKVHENRRALSYELMMEVALDQLDSR